MEFLSASNPHFAQVIAVDESFVLFSRAWCVAEVAAAHAMGMRQSIKVKSFQGLEQHEDELKHLRIEHMEATRKEDKDAILAKIPDHAAFNLHLQRLLQSDLLPAWRRMDAEKQMERVGRVLRWNRKCMTLNAQGATKQNKDVDLVDVETGVVANYMHTV